MKARFHHTGNSIDYTPGSAVAAGSVVVSNGLVGIATHDIAADTLGSLTVSGVFSVESTGGTINFGSLVYWDADEQEATATASGNTLMGRAVAAAAGGRVLVRLNS